MRTLLESIRRYAETSVSIAIVLYLAHRMPSVMAADDQWLALDRSAQKAMDSGNYKSAENDLLQALQLTETETGIKKSIRQEASLFKLALLDVLRGKFKDAQAVLTRLLELQKSSRAGDLSEVVTLNTLAEVTQMRGDLPGSEKYLQQSKLLLPEINEEGVVAYQARVSALLSLVRASEGKVAEAESLLMQHARFARLMGTHYESRAYSLLASMYMEANRYLDAETQYGKAIALLEEDPFDLSNTPEESPYYQLASAQAGLADSYLKQGKYDQADQLIKKALSHQEQSKSRLGMAPLLMKLALVQRNQHNYEQSATSASRALEIYRKRYGSQSPMTASYVMTLGDIYRDAGDRAKALACYKEAQPMIEAALVPEHPYYMRLLRGLGTLYKEDGQYQSALPFYRGLLEQDEKSLGSNSGHVAADIDDLAEVLSKCGNDSEAAAMTKRSQKIKAGLPGAQSAEQVSHNALQELSGRPVKKKWALIVGISNFKDPELNLRYAAKDARDFANYLAEEANFPRGQIKLLIDEDATRKNIVSNLGEGFLAKDVGKDDLVVVYVSSHGGRPLDDKTGVNFLVPYDGNGNNLLGMGIPLEWLFKLTAGNIPADRCVLVLDVCHSGAALDAAGLKAQPDMGKVVAGSGQVVLCSSQKDQISWESKQYDNSVFTHWLIKSLGNKQSDIKLGQAYDDMKREVEKEVLRDRGAFQTPMKQQLFDGDKLQVSVAESQ